MIEGTGSSQTIRQKSYVGNYMVRTQSSGASSGTTTHFLHDDHLGSVDLITDVNGNIIERKGYDVFGDVRVALLASHLHGVHPATV